MDIQLKKWGNSLGLRIPRRLAESFGWNESSTVEMIGELICSCAVVRSFESI
ncbi:MAG: AbrB/MazE/SpoVT family DNA-binding domain-containing protein [Nodosilinea sp.]